MSKTAEEKAWVIAWPHSELLEGKAEDVLIRNIAAALLEERELGRKTEATKYQDLVNVAQEVLDYFQPEDYWRCDEGFDDCEVADPHEDNEGVRCDFHDMLERFRSAIHALNNKEQPND